MLRIYLVALAIFCFSGVLGGQSPNADSISALFENLSTDIAEDARLDVLGLLNKYGYPGESHEVITEDGYVLTMHRIKGRKGELVETSEKKSVVFLMHGLLSSSADWINAGVDIGIGYQLADEGYDVWMGNARGNFYSRKHISMSPDESEFWKFSWNEIGYYDLPAMIDRVLEVTGESKIHYAGHSQGTTSFFVMTSRRPEYNVRIKSMHALAPVAYMSNMVSPLIRFLAPYSNSVNIITSLIGMNEVLPNTELLTIAADMLCTDGSALQPVCSNILFLLCGFNPDLHNTTILPVIFGHTPAGAASRQIIHYMQEVNSAKFRQYDYGRIRNLRKYGSLSPPNYDLSLVTAPVFLHYSDNDWMAAVKDVQQLYRELGNPIGMFRVPHDKFNHLDYLWATDIRNLLTNRVISFMKMFD